MTIVRRANHPFYSLFDNFLNEEFNKSTGGKNLPPVNVNEREKEFEVELIAPGYVKEDFKIKLDKDVLTISAEVEQSAEAKDGEKTLRREFVSKSFSRSFTLPDNIEGDNIGAKYENGILKVVIPKKEVALDEGVKEIAVG